MVKVYITFVWHSFHFQCVPFSSRFWLKCFIFNIDLLEKNRNWDKTSQFSLTYNFAFHFQFCFNQKSFHRLCRFTKFFTSQSFKSHSSFPCPVILPAQRPQKNMKKLNVVYVTMPANKPSVNPHLIYLNHKELAVVALFNERPFHLRRHISPVTHG